MTTPDENKEIYRQYIEEVWNQGRADASPKYLAVNAVAPSAPTLPPGPEGMRIIVEMFLAAFPDFHMTLEDIIAEGDIVAARFTETGTHRGVFMGIPATNRQVRFTEMAMVRFADGLIVEPVGDGHGQSLPAARRHAGWRAGRNNQHPTSLNR